MTETDWKEIYAAYVMLKNSTMTKIEGSFWSVYRVGLNIRIDIKETT